MTFGSDVYLNALLHSQEYSASTEDDGKSQKCCMETFGDLLVHTPTQMGLLPVLNQVSQDLCNQILKTHMSGDPVPFLDNSITCSLLPLQ